MCVFMRTHISSCQSLPVNLDLIITFDIRPNPSNFESNLFICAFINEASDLNKQKQISCDCSLQRERRHESNLWPLSHRYTSSENTHDNRESIVLMRNMPPLVFLMKNQNSERSKGEEGSPGSIRRSTAVSLQSACVLQQMSPHFYSVQ